MGLFDVFSNIGKQVKTGLVGAIQTVKNKIATLAPPVYKKVEAITNTLYW